MRYHATTTLALTALLSANPCAQEETPKAQEDLWTQDFAAAKQKAAEEDKSLLLDFTGSDWCGWCIRLDEEVFSKETFRSQVPDDFVLVKLDYPRDEALVTEEVRAQNAKLQQEYDIRGYPTILLTDAKGRPYAKTGYQKGGAESYVEHLEELQAGKDEWIAALEAAESSEGAERAGHLDEAMDIVGDELALGYYRERVEEIVALDPEDELGLKSKYEIRLLGARLESTFQELARAGEWEQAEKEVGAMVKKLEEAGRPELLQQALFYQAVAVIEGGDPAAGLELFEKAVAASPDSRMAEHIETNVIPKVKEMVKGPNKGDGR